jgi:predicted esterase
MAEQIFQGTESLPETMAARQLFILLRGVGARSHDLLPLANKLRNAFSGDVFLLPDGALNNA